MNLILLVDENLRQINECKKNSLQSTVSYILHSINDTVEILGQDIYSRNQNNKKNTLKYE